MIRFFHTSDWHLGKSLFAKSLLGDQRQALAELRERIEAEKPHILLIAGDIFDRSIPPEEAVAAFDTFLREVVQDLGVPVAVVPGNHDSATRLGAHSSLLRSSGVHMLSTCDAILSPIVLEHDAVEVAIYGIPFMEPAEWAFWFSAQDGFHDIEIRTHDHALAAILQRLEPMLVEDRKRGRRTVLMLHAYAQGGESTESERPFSIGGSDSVDAKRFAAFDYVALGHLHRPQSVGSQRVRYPGSLFPYSGSESRQAKGFIRGELGKDRTCDSFGFVPFEKSRSLLQFRGPFEEALALPPTNDYVIAMLTEALMPFEAFRRLQAVHPGLLHVGRELAVAAELESGRESLRRREQQADGDVLAEFLAASQTAGATLTEEDRDWLINQLDTFVRRPDA